MQLFGLGWVLRHFGFIGGLILLALFAIVGAILGLRYAKQNRKTTKRQSALNDLKYAMYLWTVWWLCFGVQYLKLNNFWWWLGYNIFAFIGAYILALILLDVEDGLIDNDPRAKTWQWAISSVIIAFVTLGFWGTEALPVLSLDKQERVSYDYARLPSSDLFSATAYLESLNQIQGWHPYFYAMGNIRLAKREEAARDFQNYADNLPTEKKALWLAMASFFHNDFWAAEKYFKEAGLDQFALFSRFRNRQLTSADVAQFYNSHQILDDQLELFANIRRTVASFEIQRNALKGSLENPDNARILEEIQTLKKMIQGNLNVEDSNKMRLALDLNIDQQIVDFAAHQAPEIAIPAMARYHHSRTYARNVGAGMSAFAFFFGVLLFTNWMLKENEKKVDAWLLDAWLLRFHPSWSKIKSQFSKLGWHSKRARLIVARLASMEPHDQKGLFSEEIASISAAVFPVDVLLGWRYLSKAKKILWLKKINAQELEDLVFIHGLIRKLSGMIIPQGDEQALGIASALRDRADSTLDGYRKGQLPFLAARNQLLATEKELVTLGDILEALGTKPEVTKFHMLGLEPKRGLTTQEVKQGYRSVMMAIHPDRNVDNIPVENLSKLVNDSYAVLVNPNRREAYEVLLGL